MRKRIGNLIAILLPVVMLAATPASGQTCYHAGEREVCMDQVEGLVGIQVEATPDQLKG